MRNPPPLRLPNVMSLQAQIEAFMFAGERAILQKSSVAEIIAFIS